MKRRFKEAKLKEEHLPMLMEAFLQRTKKITGDRAAEEKLKIADEMIRKEVSKKEHSIPSSARLIKLQSS